jgi:hypothetical protein
MKNLGLVLVLSLVSQAALAGDWQAALSCDGGAAIVDLATGYKQNAQIVIRNRAVLNFFQSHGMAQMRWGQEELVIQGRRGYINHSRSDIDLITQDFSGPQSFDTFTTLQGTLGYGGSANVYHVHRQDGGVAVKLFYVKAPYSRYVDENQGFYVNEPGYTSFIGEYIFSDCRPL